MGVVEPLLILAMAALNLAVMAGRVGANELVADTKTGGNVLFRVGKAIGKLKAVIGLNTRNDDAAPSEPGSHLFEKVRGGVGALFPISAKETHTAVLVDGGVLEKIRLATQNWTEKIRSW